MKKILIVFLLLMLSACSRHAFSINTDNVNVMDYETQEIDDALHSAEYLVIDMSDCDYLYAKNADARMYPASLTKLVTMDAVLNLSEDLSDHSSVTYDQVEALIDEDASLAYIQRDYPYTLSDLLYGLILPSGADAALALENYYDSLGISLVDEMNTLCQELGCTMTHFTNSTGLHDDDHYTCLNDLYLVVRDILKFEKGREILNSLSHTLEDGTVVRTTMGVAYRDLDFVILGGKTGYTPEAGQNIITLCKDKGRSYLVMTGNAYGNYSENQYWHYDDVVKIFEYMHKD